MRLVIDANVVFSLLIAPGSKVSDTFFRKDLEYFALALSLSCPFWTNDKKLREQDALNVLSTSEVLALWG